MKHGLVRARLLSAVALLPAIGLFSSIAQAAKEPGADVPAPAVGSPETRAIPSDHEIIVTAQRRAERLEDVPAAVVALSGDKLLSAGVSRFQDLGTVATGVMIGRTGVITQPTVRGVTSLAVGVGAEGNVGAYIDGFFIADLTMMNQDFANLQSVQVLKGPQGSLYGRNATGGAILIQTLDPGEEMAGSFTGSYGTFNDIRASGYVSAPLTEGVAVSASGYYRKNDGYLRDLNGLRVSSFSPANPYSKTVGPGQNAAPYRNSSIRTKILLQPTENFRAILGYNHFFQEDARSITYPLNAGNILPSILPLINGAAAAGNLTATTGIDRTSLNYRPYSISEGDMYTLMLELKTEGAGTFTSRTSYLDKRDVQTFDFDGIPSPVELVNFHAVYGRTAFTQSLDWSYDEAENLELLAGLFYYEDDAEQPLSFNNGAANPVGTVTRTDLKTKYSISGYVDATYQFGDKLFVTLGGRYTKDRRSVEAETDSGTPGTFRSIRGIDPSTGLPAAPEKSFEAFTPRAVVRYNLSPGANIYASFSQGFKAGTYSTSAPLAPVSPEKITAYEVGAKLNQGAVRAEVSAFYYDYKNLQVSSFAIQGTATQTVVNAVSSRIYGVDATFAARLGSAVNVYAGVAYLHARYRNFTGARGNSISSTDGRNIIDSSLNYAPQDWSGLQMVRSPDWSGNFGADVTFDAFGGKLVLNGSGSFSSAFAPSSDAIFQYQATTPAGAVVPGITSVTRKRRYVENGYIMASVQANWTDASGHLTIGVYSDNVFNTRYKIVSSGSAFGSYNIYSEPRMTGVRVGFRY